MTSRSVWIENETGKCPCDRSVWVDVMRANGEIDVAMRAGTWNWSKAREVESAGVSPIFAWRKSTVQLCGEYGPGVTIRLRPVAA